MDVKTKTTPEEPCDAGRGKRALFRGIS